MEKTAAQIRAEAEAMLAFDLAVGGAPIVGPKPVEAMSDKGAQHLVAMVFKSSSEGDPHVVTRRDEYDGTVRLTCTCLASGDHPCWAVSDFKRVAGL